MTDFSVPVPANLITGFLGVGKTTAILDLLRHRPAGDRWAVIVNEYGEVGIDGAILADAADGSLDIREVEGGCICCTSAAEFNLTLAQVYDALSYYEDHQAEVNRSLQVNTPEAWRENLVQRLGADTARHLLGE